MGIATIHGNCMGTVLHMSCVCQELTGFYPSPKSFWFHTHVNSCQ